MCFVYSCLSFPGPKLSVVLWSILACVQVKGMNNPTLLNDGKTRDVPHPAWSRRTQREKECREHLYWVAVTGRNSFSPPLLSLPWIHFKLIQGHWGNKILCFQLLEVRITLFLIVLMFIKVWLLKTKLIRKHEDCILIIWRNTFSIWHFFRVIWTR